MYRTILWVVLAAVAVTGTPASAAKAAKDTRDWANVQSVKPGTLLLIAMKGGSAVRGNFESATDTSVAVNRWDGGGEETLARDEVKTITRVVGQGLGPDQVRKRLLIGAAVGAVAGAAVGGSRDLRQGTNYKWAIGAPAGALLGIPAAGAVTIVQILVQDAKLKGERTVYASR
jgi:hypothetical protein